VDALEASLAGAGSMAAGFNAEMIRIHQTFADTGRSAARFETTLGRGLSKAIDGVVLDGMKLSGESQLDLRF